MKRLWMLAFLPCSAIAVELPADLRDTLEKGERFELLSIRPARVERAERHGIRVTHKGRVTDFIVCFECYQTQVYVDDRPQKALLVTRSPEAVFNQSLKDAKLPLSDQ
jgi:hypothetical protein